MAKEVEGILFEYDEEKVKAIVVDFEDKEITLDKMYKLIGCNMLDCVSLPNKIDVWVNDEGLLESNNSVIHYIVKEDDGYEEFDLHLAGKALFVSSNEDGETVGLSKDQIYWIQNNIKAGLYGFTK